MAAKSDSCLQSASLRAYLESRSLPKRCRNTVLCGSSSVGDTAFIGRNWTKTSALKTYSSDNRPARALDRFHGGRNSFRKSPPNRAIEENVGNSLRLNFVLNQLAHDPAGRMGWRRRLRSSQFRHFTAFPGFLTPSKCIQFLPTLALLASVLSRFWNYPLQRAPPSTTSGPRASRFYLLPTAFCLFLPPLPQSARYNGISPDLILSYLPFASAYLL